jgi:kynurenine formamidase
MCAPGCTEHVMAEVSRRRVLLGAGVGVAATVAPTSAMARSFPAYSNIVDLTHTHSPEFPTYEGEPGVSLKKLKDFKKDGYNLYEWTLLEHSGTHMDAPLHFSADGPGPESLPVEQLVVPLAVINVAAKAGADRDYLLTPDDVIGWERLHGRLPDGCCVAMDSGWRRHMGSDKFAGRDVHGVLHFPGFHPETAHMLLTDRLVTGMGVDTLSLDNGPSTDFETHVAWLSAGRWGLENVTNLDLLPPVGATIVVGAPKIKGATGGLTRVLALT